jgi:hypothetical protein
MDILGVEHSFLDFPTTSDSQNLGKTNYTPLAIFKKKLGWITGNLPYKKKSSQVRGLLRAGRPRPFFFLYFILFFFFNLILHNWIFIDFSCFFFLISSFNILFLFNWAM